MAIVICVNLSERSKAELDQLVEQGSYRDYSEAVAVAVSNQLTLHGRAKSGGAFVISSDQTPTDPPSDVEAQRSDAASQLQPLARAVPPGFSLAVALRCQSEPAPPPDDVFSKGSTVAVDRWFFGQHNKLLPAKATARALAVLLAERPMGIPIADAAPRVAKDAALLGDYLRYLDSQSGALREEALATAFPTTGDDSDRSRLRYANQFIGNLNTQSQLSGLLVDLKVVNYLRGKQPLLLLTEAGLKFAKLANPILDDATHSNGGSHSRFSSEEIGFLLRHIRDHVPVEDFAFRTILTALKRGNNTPNKLDAELKAAMPRGKRSISDAFVTTQRSGVISRMSDLDMVLRRRDGIRVTYESTPRGTSYLNGSIGADNEQ